MWLAVQEVPIGADPLVAYWSIAGNVVAVLAAAAGVIAWVRRWANKYLGQLVTRTLAAQGDIMKTTTTIASGIKDLTDDVKALTGQVERVVLRVDNTDRRLEDHLREAEMRSARFDAHIADHYLHSQPGPTRRR